MLFDIEEVEISCIRPQKSKIQKNWGTQHKLIIPQLSRLQSSLHDHAEYFYISK